jgi:hypothetical protein
LGRSFDIMVFAIGVFVVLSAALFLFYWARAPRSVPAANLGRMSTQWVAERRASKSS